MKIHLHIYLYPNSNQRCRDKVQLPHYAPCTRTGKSYVSVLNLKNKLFQFNLFLS